MRTSQHPMLRLIPLCAQEAGWATQKTPRQICDQGRSLPARGKRL